jgi:hypothetical protein
MLILAGMLFDTLEQNSVGAMGANLDIPVPGPPALLVVVYRRRLPETPRFLLSKGRIDDANRSLAVLGSTRCAPASTRRRRDR